jgi:hypothetical protein
MSCGAKRRNAFIGFFVLSKPCFAIVVDVDDPTRPCELCEVEIEGEW